MKDIWVRKKKLFLEIFNSSTDVDVLRSIIASLDLNKNNYPLEQQILVDQAIKKARSHKDEYISHRVEVQLWNTDLLKPLPERNIPVKHVDLNGSYATDPLHAKLSTEKLRLLAPNLFSRKRFFSNLIFGNQIEAFQEYLYFGDSNPAVVIKLDPLLVACYSGDFDAGLF